MWLLGDLADQTQGMGVKAVSTPILASETAVGFWRGSAILAWQLWYVRVLHGDGRSLTNWQGRIWHHDGLRLQLAFYDG